LFYLWQERDKEKYQLYISNQRFIRHFKVSNNNLTDLWQKCQDYTMGKDNPFNKRCWGNDCQTCKRMKLDYLPHRQKSTQNGLET
jgi:hypothetical protein